MQDGETQKLIIIMDGFRVIPLTLVMEIIYTTERTFSSLYPNNIVKVCKTMQSFRHFPFYL